MWKDYEQTDKIDENFKEGSVKDHIISVLQQADNESPIVKLAALFHDVGKPATYKDREGKKTFYGHDVVGVKIFNDIADRMKISNAERDSINFAISGHMKMHSFCEMRYSKCVTMMEDKNWEILKAVSFADDKSRKFAFDEAEHQQIVDKIERLETVVKQNQITKQFLNGNLVMDYCGIKGKIIGDVLKKVRDFVINNNIDVTTPEGKQKVYDQLDKHKMKKQMTEITEQDVRKYLASCFNTSIEMMPLVELKLPNRHHLQWCSENNVNKFVRVTVAILGYACYVYWRYSDWIDYSKWNNQAVIIGTWGHDVNNWILLKKLEILSD